MVNRDAAFSHHRFKIAVADWVPAVPAHRPEHDLTPEVTSLEVVHAPTPHPIQRREFTNPDELCNRALLAFFGSRGRFPRFESAVEQRVIDALGEQLDAPAPAGDGELLTARTAERFRAEIRAYFGFREATVAVADALIVWLRDHAAPKAAGALDVLVERLETRCREQALKPPAPDRIERIVRAAQRAHLDRFHTAVYERRRPTGASMNCSYRRSSRTATAPSLPPPRCSTASSNAGRSPPDPRPRDTYRRPVHHRPRRRRAGGTCRHHPKESPSMTAQTLPDDPNYCFVPAYDIEDEVRQIRIVVDGMTGYIPTALLP